MADKINIGIIGVGQWGPNLVRNFHDHDSSKVIKVADHSSDRLEFIKERYPDIAVTAQADEIFQDDNIAAVVISTPTTTHYALTLAALKNNKHVLVEKPIAVKLEECRELIAVAKRMERVLFVGHTFVYNPGIQAVKKLVREEILGKIYYFHMTRTNLGPVRTDVNALWDLATHDISILQYILDELPSRVSATGGSFLNGRVEDVVFANYKYRGDVIANIHVSWLNPKKVRQMVIVGEKKMLIWDDLDLKNPIQVLEKKIIMEPVADKLDTFLKYRTAIHVGDILFPAIAQNEPLAEECNAFLKALGDPNSSLSTGEHGLAVVQVLLATEESLKQNGSEIAITY